MFPWRVASVQKNNHPTIVDATGRVVCVLLSGGIEAAKRIVDNCNRSAAERGVDAV